MSVTKENNIKLSAMWPLNAFKDKLDKVQFISSQDYI